MYYKSLCMTRSWRADLVAKCMNCTSVSSTTMVAHNHLQPQIQGLWWPLLSSQGHSTHTCTTHTCTQNYKHCNKTQNSILSFKDKLGFALLTKPGRAMGVWAGREQLPVITVVSHPHKEHRLRGWWDGSVGKSTRLFFQRSEVQIPATTWWLTTTHNEIWCPLLVRLKTSTVYLHIINK